ncbi:MAG: class I SAM-dependent methyltransferase [bacterium]
MNKKTIEKIVKCIYCNGSIRLLKDKIICQKCNRQYIIDDKVIMMNFRKDDYFENYEQICEDDLRKEKTPMEVKQEMATFILSDTETQNNKIIADFGSGDAYLLRKMTFNTTVAIDIAANYLKRCKKVNIKINADLEKLPIHNESIDIGICTDVIEHVIDDERVIQNIYDVIKPKGILYLAVPWEQDLSVYKLPEYKVKYGKYKYVHLRTLNKEYMRDKIFSKFKQEKEMLITAGMKYMEFTPYPIKIFRLIK